MDAEEARRLADEARDPATLAREAVEYIHGWVESCASRGEREFSMESYWSEPVLAIALAQLREEGYEASSYWTGLFSKDLMIKVSW